jgi:CMP-N-acetylneuraminic acid synthetase
MQAAEADGCLSVREAADSPWLMYQRLSSGWIKPVLPPWSAGMRRQDLPPVYLLNGAFYFIRRDILLRERTLLTKRCVSYVMPPNQSIDIDTLSDFEEAEAYLINKVS